MQVGNGSQQPSDKKQLVAKEATWEWGEESMLSEEKQHYEKVWEQESPLYFTICYLVLFTSVPSNISVKVCLSLPMQRFMHNA